MPRGTSYFQISTNMSYPADSTYFRNAGLVLVVKSLCSRK